ncbi:MAG: hypothetical protein PHF33_05715 [Candidatus Delongbacteria bacterium]|nr:hypothetical protein [Candidatus Delongbacteria bacterium]
MKDISSVDARVVSFKDKIWKGKNILRRIILLNNYDCVHFFWGNVKIFDFLFYRIFSGVKIINHFMGTDLHNILKSKRKTLELRMCAIISKIVVVGYVLSEELSEIGINNDIVYIINHEVVKKEFTFPDDRKVIAYIPSTRKTFFRHDFLLKLSEDHPDIKFTWFPYTKEADEYVPKNVSVIPYIQKDQVLTEMQKHKIFIRIPIHDGGAPLSLIEALNIGRWCIWTFNMENVNKIDSYNDLKSNLEKLIEKNDYNMKGEVFVLEHFDFPKIVAGFTELYIKMGLI